MDRLRTRMANRIRRLQRRQGKLVDDCGYVSADKREEYQELMKEVVLCNEGLSWLQSLERTEPC